MGWKSRWVIADGTAATLGSQEFKNKHTRSESTGNVLMLQKLYLFVFVYESSGAKLTVSFLVIFEKDLRVPIPIAACPLHCMIFHYYHFVSLYYLISISGQLLGNAGIPGWVDTELKNLMFIWMALSKTESDSVRELGVWVSREMPLKAGEMRWIGVDGGGQEGGTKVSQRVGGKVLAKTYFFYFPCKTKPSFYPVAFQIL